ncbi:MAG: hypothetical protein WAN65_04670 [Candidatus Sulfotelmatobacter sp.]
MPAEERLYAAVVAAVKGGKLDKAELVRRLDAVGAAACDGSGWRDGFQSFEQLSKKPPKFLIGGYRGLPGGLIPEKALTAIPAPSYNCKTWFALAVGRSIATGQELWGGFKGPSEPVKVRYHVPEMNEAFVRSYMSIIGFEDVDPEYFLVRPMEKGIWSLDDPRMLRSSEGCCVFLDTAGYFNPTDDVANYQQSLKFANLVFNLLQHGSLAVVGLFHPPKYAKQDNLEWSLENSILGSAGYGGILRSCLRMQNLNKDLNDSNAWVYVQGLKNPGLKPFQLTGPVPLMMKVAPGASPYLKDLASNADPRQAKAFAMFDAKKNSKEIGKELKASMNTVVKWRVEWEMANKKEEVPEQGDFVDGQMGQED